MCMNELLEMNLEDSSISGLGMLLMSQQLLQACTFLNVAQLCVGYLRTVPARHCIGSVNELMSYGQLLLMKQRINTLTA